MKERNERAIGDKFVAAYNSHHGSNFVFIERPIEAPDLTYADGPSTLNVEVGTAYYGYADAELQWKAARGSPDAPKDWAGMDFEDKMVDDITAIIAEKCGKDYGPSCVLVMHVRPKLTTINDLRAQIDRITIPSVHRFDGIYLSGDFPDGYSCWRLDPPSAAPRSGRC